MSLNQIIFSFWLVAALLTTGKEVQAQGPPNVIIIVSDDQGYGDLGCYGSKEAVTPNLDKLAEEGVKLTDFYVSHPSCTPSRAGMLTGRYPQRYGTTGALLIRHHAAFSKDGKWSGGIPVSEILLSELLKENGYSTGVFGKWHIGFTPGQQPNNRGFDRSHVCAAGHTDYFTGLFFGVPDIYKNGELIDFSGYTTDVFADEAIDFIRETKDKPFFVYLPFNAVHYSCPTNHPDGETKHGENYKNIVQAPDEVLKEFSEFPRQRQHYLAALKSMDQAIGRLDEALDELGLKENTLLIFFSDNGGDLDYGASNGNLHGEKGQIWDGGIRVPAIVRWPGQIPARSVCHKPLIQMDFFNMTLAAAGLEAPDDRAIDGWDPTDMLKGKSVKRSVPLYFTFHSAKAIRDKRYKLIQFGNQAAQLFDLNKDIGESKDLASKKPEVLTKLSQELDQWMNGIESEN